MSGICPDGRGLRASHPNSITRTAHVQASFNNSYGSCPRLLIDVIIRALFGVIAIFASHVQRSNWLQAKPRLNYVVVLDSGGGPHSSLSRV